MIPFINVPRLTLGPLDFKPFGLLVVTGVIVGILLTIQRAKLLGYDQKELKNFIIAILVAGFISGHVLDLIFYHPELIVQRPWMLLNIWGGQSSFGGFLGAIIGAVFWKYCRGFKRRKRPIPVLPFADLIIACFAVAWIFGRAGCSMTHDHLGIDAPVDSLFAVASPAFQGDGERIHFLFFDLIWGNRPRYDLGLLELILTIMIVIIIALMRKKKRPLGTYIVTIALLYSPARFVMDFYRMTDGPTGDIRFGNLTFAQWSCIIFFLYGLCMIRYMRLMRERGFDLEAPLRVPSSSSIPVMFNDKQVTE